MWNTGHRGPGGQQRGFPSVQAREDGGLDQGNGNGGGKQWEGSEGLVAIVDVGWAA